MNLKNKENLLNEIKQLLSTNNNKLDINEKYIEYFDIDDLEDIKNILLDKKNNNKTPNKDYLNDIFESCS